MIRLANKPLWVEGMLLTQQQFQQQERYFETQLQFAQTARSTDGWGLLSLELETQYFAQAKFGVRTASGIFADGTRIALAENAVAPAFIDIPSTAQNLTVYLAIPLTKDSEPLVSLAEDAMNHCRYLSDQESVRNYTHHDRTEAVVDIGRLQLSLMTDADDLTQHSVIPIARINSVDQNKGIILEKQFLPSMLACASHDSLSQIVNEIHALLIHRATTLADRVQLQSNNHVANICEFLLLQCTNRAEMLFAHLKQRADLHPRDLFEQAIALYGELVTLCLPTKRPNKEFSYQHNNLTASFLPLMQALRELLQLVIAQNAVKIQLTESTNGIFQASIDDYTLFEQASFVLAVKADLEATDLVAKAPVQLKLGPLTMIHALVNAQVPGIELKQLSVAPPQIPYYAGFNYFELNASNALWQQVKECKGLALHVGGDFPGLKLACWAIRN